MKKKTQKDKGFIKGNNKNITPPKILDVFKVCLDLLAFSWK